MTQQNTPSNTKILWTTIITLVVALLLLVLVVMPAEYGVDPTGFGTAVGLMPAEEEGNVEVIEVRDVVGGNETLREVEVPDVGDPTPLPNPAVFQDQAEAAGSETLEIELPVDGQTEIKLYMEEGKVALYSWSVEEGDVYVDFHGHDPSFGDDFFVRYKEQQQADGNHGSLTAPFSGEHGWYWLNINEHPVTITLEVTGYYEDLIDYGLF